MATLMQSEMYTVLDRKGWIQAWLLSWNESTFLCNEIIPKQRDQPVKPLHFWPIFASNTRIGAGRKDHAPGLTFLCASDEEPVLSWSRWVMRMSWNLRSGSAFSHLSRPGAHHYV